MISSFLRARKLARKGSWVISFWYLERSDTRHTCRVLAFLGCNPLHDEQKGQNERKYVDGVDMVDRNGRAGTKGEEGVCDPLLNGSPGMKWPSPGMSGDEWG